jgi:hypothetical protein
MRSNLYSAICECEENVWWLRNPGSFFVSHQKELLIYSVLGVRLNDLPSRDITANGIDDVRYIEMFDEHGG